MSAKATTERVVGLFFGLWVLVAICLQTWGVFSRNILNTSTAWIDDIQRLNFIWLIWILAAIAYGTRGLIRLDMLQTALTSRPRAYHGVSLGIAVCELIFGASFVFLSGQILRTHLNSGEATVSLSIPLWVLTLGFFLGSLLLAVFAARNVVREAARWANNAPVEHENEIELEVEEALEAEAFEASGDAGRQDGTGTGRNS